MNHIIVIAWGLSSGGVSASGIGINSAQEVGQTYLPLVESIESKPGFAFGRKRRTTVSAQNAIPNL